MDADEDQACNSAALGCCLTQTLRSEQSEQVDGHANSATVRFYPWRLVAVVLLLGVLVGLVQLGRDWLDEQFPGAPPMTDQSRAEIMAMDCKLLRSIEPAMKSEANSVGGGALEEWSLIRKRLDQLECPLIG